MEAQKTKDRIGRRAVAATDHAFVHRVHDEAYRDLIVRQFGAWDQALEDTYFENIWSHPGLEIVEFDGEPCGFFCVDSTDDELFIYEMVLDPNAQGKGIGTYLLGQVQERSTQEERKLKLEVLRYNGRARALYERFGFKLVGQNDTHDQMEWLPGSSN